jgi:putative glutamine amidotransferase
MTGPSPPVDGASGSTRRPRVGLSAHPRVVDVASGPTSLHTVSHWYVDGIVRAGGLPVILPVLDPALAEQALSGVDAVLLTGGGDVDPSTYDRAPEEKTAGVDPLRDAWELALIAAALAARVPTLAVCRGAQILNVALGGTLQQHIGRTTGTRHMWTSHWSEPVHSVSIAPDSRLAIALGATELEVNSLHHQAVATVGPGVRPVGWAPDGTIEAIEIDAHPEVVAVQWHPELLAEDPVQRGLFRAVVEAAEAQIST